MDINSVNTLIVDQQTLQNSAKKPGSWKRFILPAIYVFLIIVVVYEVYAGVTSLSDSTSSQKNLITNSDVPVSDIAPQPTGDAVLALVLDKAQYKLGDKIPVVVQVSTTGKIITRVEAVIKYEPKYLSLEGDDLFVESTLFTNKPLVTKDDKKGFIRISGDTGSPMTGFNGVGNLGTINFTARDAGITPLSVDYVKNGGKDSNVVELSTNKDILGKVYNIVIEVTK